MPKKQIGEIIIDAVCKASALESAEVHNGGTLFIWRYNAVEQIEAALEEFGVTIQVDGEKMKLLGYKLDHTIGDNQALACPNCGSVAWSLLRSKKIECSKCLNILDANWSKK